MPIGPAELPTDVAALQAMVRAQEAELAAARAGIIAQRHEIEKLKARIARLLRQSYGSSSERLRAQIEQFELQLAEIDELLAESKSPSADTATTAPEAHRPKRRPLPAILPRETIEHQAPETCPACGDALRPLGEDVTEVLDYVPGSFRVIRHVRPKFSCRSCESIAQAPAPSLPIRRGRAGAGLLAHVLASKYCDHRVPRTHQQRWRCGAV